tara:strand:+ start:208 stop:708 length:501 start_codon:yes stop_codon:yes gene_type:complete
MFYVKKLSIELPLEPKFFGANLSTALSKIIISKLEGTVQEDYGTLVKVIEVFVDDMSASGVIEHDTGRVHFNVSYQGLFMRCFKNEIVDFEVSNVNELGFFGMIGPMRMLVTTYQMTEVSDCDCKFRLEREEIWIWCEMLTHHTFGLAGVHLEQGQGELHYRRWGD